MELLAHPRYEDFDIEYHNRNRWQWLGNGFSIHDLDGSDTTWFWGELNEIKKLEMK
jgi:hypothetical protein